MNRRKCQRVHSIEVISLDRNAQRDEREVNSAAARLIWRGDTRAADLEIYEAREAR
jgi:hypothetical protein